MTAWGPQAACSLGLRHCPDRCLDVLFCRRKVVSCLCHRCSRCFDDRLSACNVTFPDACFECAGRSGICRRFNDHEHAAADRRRNCNGSCDELSCDGSGSIIRKRIPALHKRRPLRLLLHGRPGDCRPYCVADPEGTHEEFGC